MYRTFQGVNVHFISVDMTEMFSKYNFMNNLTDWVSTRQCLERTATFTTAEQERALKTFKKTFFIFIFPSSFFFALNTQKKREHLFLKTFSQKDVFFFPLTKHDDR